MSLSYHRNTAFTLDVGCGHTPRGDVNIDLFPEKTRHRSYNQDKLIDYNINLQTTPNFIVASSEALPFKDNCFDYVISSHVLEHCNGYKMFSEMVRVSRDIIHIVCPNQVGCIQSKWSIYHWSKHIYPVNLTWFYAMARRFKLIFIHIKYSGYQYLPHYYIPLIRIPNEITFIARKPNY